MAFCEVESEIDREFDLGVPSDDGCESCLWHERMPACWRACRWALSLQRLLVASGVGCDGVLLCTASHLAILSCFFWKTDKSAALSAQAAAAAVTGQLLSVLSTTVASPNANSPHTKSLLVRPPSCSCCTRQRCPTARTDESFCGRRLPLL